MKRFLTRALSFAFIGIFIAWLAFSYRPDALLQEPLALGDEFTPLLRLLLLLSAVLFVALQVMLLPATLRFPERVSRSEKGQEQASPGHNGLEAALVLQAAPAGDIRVNRALEFVWTGLPILISLGLFWASYQAINW